MQTGEQRTERPSVVLRRHLDQVLALFHQFGIRDICVFGSIARGEDTVQSDVDFIVDFPDQATMFQLAALRQGLDGILHLPFELLTYKALRPEVLARFLANSVRLEQLPQLNDENRVQSDFSPASRLERNLHSLLWVIARIDHSLAGVSRAEFMASEALQDAVTRNIQLFGQVCSQIPACDLARMRATRGLGLAEIIVLRDVLFMSVDLELLWNTVQVDLPLYKREIAAELAARKGGMAVTEKS